MVREALPPDFRRVIDTVYYPLADALCRKRRGMTGESPLVVGINGAQGTGKSTLARFVAAILAHRQGFRVVTLSLDDLYLTRRQRSDLAARVHPLLRTRGVPGTHDIDLGMAVIERLRNAGPTTATAIPRFDKARDDRLPEDRWSRFRGRPDLILMEGWCLGAVPQDEADLVVPINRLEADEDADGQWRRYANSQLADTYPALFGQLDVLIMLKVPGWESVYRWRLEQEEKLRASRREEVSGARFMAPEQVARFVAHYERLTRHQLLEMPARADAVVALNPGHGADRVYGPLVEG